MIGSEARQAAFAAMHGPDLLYLFRDAGPWGKPMRRREFITLLGGAAAVWPLAARAQQTTRRPRVGVLLYSTPQADSNAETFRRALRALGYVEGSNIAIEYRFADGRPERLPALAGELVRMQPDVLFSLGSDVAQIALAATHTIPVVFVASADPVQLGFVKSLAQPDGNGTGVTLLQDDLASKRLELLKEAAPQVSHVAFLYDPDHVDSELRQAESAAARLSVTLHSRCCSVGCPTPAISCLGASLTPAVGAWGLPSSSRRQRNLHNSSPR